MRPVWMRRASYARAIALLELMLNFLKIRPSARCCEIVFHWSSSFSVDDQA